MAAGAELDSDEERELEESDTSGESLFGVIDRDKVRALNENKADTGKNVIKPYDARASMSPCLESPDDDPELILFIPFTEVVKIKSICIGGGPEDTAPSRAHIFVNRDDIDFTTAEDMEPTQVIDLPGGGDLRSTMFHPVRPGKFHSVHSITVYITDSQGGDSTRLHYVGFKGVKTGNKRGIVEGVVYEALPQPKLNDPSRADAVGSHSLIGP